eukprot:gb/GECG01011457.1/.p1 GENE.gb/GECG01011457.1/~~gb/GECG01011457.1/.p1  ORF type:complete len:114 (+),score=9.43 gb/GECG01011457.1/:1-342(+)
MKDKVQGYYKSAMQRTSMRPRVRTATSNSSSPTSFPSHLYDPRHHRKYVEHPSSKYYEEMYKSDSSGSGSLMPSHFGPYSALEVIRVRRLFEVSMVERGAIDIDAVQVFLVCV